MLIPQSIEDQITDTLAAARPIVSAILILIIVVSLIMLFSDNDGMRAGWIIWMILP